VLGLGYVGLPLSVALARAGFHVRGIDIDATKIGALRQGQTYIPDVSPAALATVLGRPEAGAPNRFEPTTDYASLAGVDAVVISVPTPMTRMKQPDMRHVVAAAEGILPNLRPGMLIVLQSTTYPGATERDLRPILEHGGLRAGVDFHLAFVPERINPGDARFRVDNIPTIIGGLTPRCSQLAAELFHAMGTPVSIVSSPATAEMVKCYENAFRFVNIALANEMALLCERMQLNVWEVIDAAKTKPFGFLAHYPSAGVGGHCILVDPYYLAAAAREYDMNLGFVEHAAHVNEGMPYHLVDLVRRAVAGCGVPLRGARILVLGVAFKKDINDARNSPAERIIEALLGDGADMCYHDPYVPSFPAHSDFSPRHPFHLESKDLSDELLARTDCAVVVQAHSPVNYAALAARVPVIVDACNALAGIEGDHIIRLGNNRVRERPWEPLHQPAGATGQGQPAGALA
jgi:UDP-N-acetyl-D-glucosamine dehydrogenase